MAPSRGPVQGSPSPISRISQACAACKRRKVRCDGILPCQQCKRHELSCTYMPVNARSRINSAERGAIIAESRLLSLLEDVGTPVTSSWSLPDAGALGVSSFEYPLLLNDTHDRHDTHFFHEFMIPHFMERIHPLTPVLTDAELSACVIRMDSDSDSASLVYACTAVTLLLLQNDKPWSPTCYSDATSVLNLSISHLQSLHLGDSHPTLPRLLSRIFIAMSLLVLHKTDLAFFYLREAISMILMHGIDRFLEGDDEIDPHERTRRMRIYYLCFIYERHLAIEALMGVCLEPLPSGLPDATGTLTNSVERGWNSIVQTFTIIDTDFVRFWTGDRSAVTAAWIQKKHAELTDDAWHTAVDVLPATQQADLIITRQWIRTLTWQIATSNALLSSDKGQPEGLSLFMPLRLSGQLRGLLSRMSSQAVAMHGIAIIEKLFEITTTIADAIAALIAGGYHEETRENVHDLMFVKTFLLKLPHLKPIHRDIVGAKIAHVKALYENHGLGNLLEVDGSLC